MIMAYLIIDIVVKMHSKRSMSLHRLGVCVFNKITTFALGMHAPCKNSALMQCSVLHGPERNILKCNTHLERKKRVFKSCFL